LESVWNKSHPPSGGTVFGATEAEGESDSPAEHQEFCLHKYVATEMNLKEHSKK